MSSNLEQIFCMLDFRIAHVEYQAKTRYTRTLTASLSLIHMITLDIDWG